MPVVFFFSFFLDIKYAHFLIIFSLTFLPHSLSLCCGKLLNQILFSCCNTSVERSLITARF